MGSSNSGSPDYYAILALPSSATSAEIKTAYHRALLASHPDKRSSDSSDIGIDIGLLKEAFNILYTPELRKEYDATLETSKKQLGPRPAQVISLEEFEEETDSARWTYPCRCGGTYVVTEDLLDAGQHVVGCASCSEVVWVGYELVEEAVNADAKQ
ncbi:hypothetical protein C8Q80DRAFT_26326 [Daedaleopsis nitida]|nr:hypothetical protein C8Q80DRAFT_26326 [Daedaleopsis nitida]